MIKTKLDVAVGIIFNKQNQLLIAQRPAHKPHGLCWEFPGGKVEEKETIYEALCRELNEEVGIVVNAALAWQTCFYEYPHYDVTLHTYFVREYQGHPVGREGQPIRWIVATELSHYSFPPANHPLLTALKKQVE